MRDGINVFYNRTGLRNRTGGRKEPVHQRSLYVGQRDKDNQVVEAGISRFICAEWRIRRKQSFPLLRQAHQRQAVVPAEKAIRRTKEI